MSIPRSAIPLFVGAAVVACWASARADTLLSADPAHLVDAVRAARRDHPAGIVTVRVPPGTYELADTLSLPAGLGPLVIEGTGVTLSGGRTLPPWRSASLNGVPCWTTEVPSGVNFRELWVAGRRAVRARFPAEGTLPAVVPHANPKQHAPGPSAFDVRPGDLPAGGVAVGDDVEAVIADRWVVSRLPLVGVDAGAHRLRFGRPAVFDLQDGDPYWLEGSPGFLARPGDWVLDGRAVFYVPRPGEAMATTPAVAPRLAAVLACRAGDVTFRGLTFAHAEWLPPRAGYGQASIGVPAAVVLAGADRCRFDRCTFTHLGPYALEVGRNCHRDQVDHCTFTDLGAGAVRIGTEAIVPDPAADNAVTDCRIADGGHLFADAVGIWVGQSGGNRVAHNEVAGLPYTAVSLGWTWGYGPSLNAGNVVEANHIHHLGAGGTLLSDMGGVYVLGSRAGTVVRDNVVHDVAGRAYGGWGIYLDEGSCDTLVAHNLVYRTTSGGFHQHYGRDNTVRDNVLALGRDEQVARSRVEPHPSFAFRHNVVYWDHGPLTRTSTPDGVTFDDNLYGCAGGRLAFGPRDWDAWRRAGQDAHTVLADPGFVGASQDDFRFALAGAAHRLGFTAPPTPADVGPRDR